MEYRLGELFCGPGGLALGAKLAREARNGARIVHAWANDIDPDACATYRRNICPENPDSVVCGDIRRPQTLEKLSEISGIDALAFGFPCNDFSIVGEQKGISGEYGPLYLYGVKALNLFRPQWFLAENVGGLRTANEGRAFSRILFEFMQAGYSVYPHLYKFEDYGVPQARHRLIIVGIRKDLKRSFLVPAPTTADRPRTCREAIESPPIPEDAPNSERTKQAPKVVERLKYIKPGQNVFNAELPPQLRLRVKGATISQIYRRLDPDKPAYTVTGSGGGGTHVYHWSEPRALTNRERARLQTFPDDFVFEGSKESVRRQIGMAVPVEGAKLIFRAVLGSLATKKYRSVEPNMIPLAWTDRKVLQKAEFYRNLFVQEATGDYLP